MELGQALLVGFGGNAALLVLLAFLGRSVVGSILTKDLERLKADLQIAAIEHQVRFSKLHEKRAEVLAELYKLLVIAVWETSSFASPMEFTGEPDKKEKYVGAMNAIAEYFRFFDKHRIYIPAELCPALEEFATKLRSPTIRAGVYLQIEYPTEGTKKAKFEALMAAWDSVQKDIPKLRAELEEEFRKLLSGPLSDYKLNRATRL